VPPTLVRHYADAHDQAVWHTLLKLLGEAQDTALQKNKERAQLPCRLGGCGLRCSRRTAPAAYWAALADVLPTLQQRFPHWTGNLVQELEAGNEQRDCLKEALRAARRLRAEGFEPPSYEALAAGARPPNPDPGEVDAGEWRHGWQYFASSAREAYYLEHSVLPHSTRAEQALLRSQAGRNCARALTAVPSDDTLTFTPEEFAVTLRRRLRLPLFLPASHCNGCGRALDRFGDHLAACMPSGRVQARARPVELAWVKVFREAGATTHFQHFLRNSTLPVDPADNRRVDVLVTGHGLHCRALFCDATVRSPLNRSGDPHPRAATRNGAVLKKAVREKRTKYWDVHTTPLAELVVLRARLAVGGTGRHWTW